MDRCWLKGQLGDALHVVLCATGYNLRWLLRSIVRLGLKAALLGPGITDANGAHQRLPCTIRFSPSEFLAGHGA